MWNYPELDPVAISLGPIAIHWYALSYLVGISSVWWHLTRKAKVAAARPSKGSDPKQTGKKNAAKTWNDEQISDLIFYGVFGVILGGRIGYMLFYGRSQLVEDPLALFKVWQGGMSFHGGMLGVFVAAYVYGLRTGRTFFQITDFVAPSIPIALGCGRIGNFINGELPGRITEVPWAAIYPGDIVGRHPSSLYQALLEGPALFLLLWLYTRQIRPPVSVSGMFLVGYGGFRFISEFLREPDAHLGFIAFDWMTTGQLLSLPMVLIGVGFIAYSHRK